ncbi:hypothetical protein, partial [Plasmodium yoelii yoelii]
MSKRRKNIFHVHIFFTLFFFFNNSTKILCKIAICIIIKKIHQNVAITRTEQ